MNKYNQKSNPIGKISANMGELFDAFAQYLQLQADCFEDEVKRAAAESISPRGKFIRPILVFSAAGHADAGDKSLLRRAAIVELTHLSTLIHDDVIDGASVRRNAETPNKKYGAKTAVLLGDAIFAHTMGLAVEENDIDTSRRTALCVKTICEGEIRQTLADKKSRVSREKYYSIAFGKTAALFSLACALGAKSVEGADGWIDAAEEVGKHLGIAYQIYDDLCDWFMSEQDAGKTLGTDLISGKQTFPLIALLETMDKAKADEFAATLPSKNPAQVAKMMVEAGVEKVCQAEIARRIAAAEDILKPFGKLSEKLLEFCAAMRELALG